MYVGTTFLLVLNADLSRAGSIDDIIVTMRGAEELQHHVTYNEDTKQCIVPITQEISLALGTEDGHRVEVEMQVNCTSKEVWKSSIEDFILEGSIATYIVPGNYPDGRDKIELYMKF